MAQPLEDAGYEFCNGRSISKSCEARCWNARVGPSSVLSSPTLSSFCVTSRLIYSACNSAFFFLAFGTIRADAFEFRQRLSTKRVTPTQTPSSTTLSRNCQSCCGRIAGHGVVDDAGVLTWRSSTILRWRQCRRCKAVSYMTRKRGRVESRQCSFRRKRRSEELG